MNFHSLFMTGFQRLLLVDKLNGCVNTVPSFMPLKIIVKNILQKFLILPTREEEGTAKKGKFQHDASFEQEFPGLDYRKAGCDGGTLHNFDASPDSDTDLSGNKNEDDDES